jgi:hypothetical protein
LCTAFYMLSLTKEIYHVAPATLEYSLQSV